MTRTIALILRLIVAVILLQTLYFKFGGHPEAVHLFTTLVAEPWGRIGLGIIELIVAIGLLVPKKQILASFAALGIMAGAIGAHLLTPLGVVVEWNENSDNGQLFFMACLSFIFLVIHLLLYSRQMQYSLKELIRKEIFKKV